MLRQRGLRQRLLWALGHRAGIAQGGRSLDPMTPSDRTELGSNLPG